MSDAVNPSTPDAISMKDLVAFQENAPAEKEYKKEEGPFAGWTKDDLCEMVNDKMQEISELCGHPLAHKLAAFYVIQNMVGWHTSCGVDHFKDGDVECGVSWLRDAGKFQAMANILASISLGPNDFTCDQDDEEEVEE